jgi:hypothetical protein
MVFFALAIVTVVLGAARTFRHQQYLIKSKALAGGFEPTALGGLLLAVCGALLHLEKVACEVLIAASFFLPALVLLLPWIHCQCPRRVKNC